MNKKNKYHHFPNSHASGADLLNDLMGDSGSDNEDPSRTAAKNRMHEAYTADANLPPYSPESMGSVGGLFATGDEDPSKEPVFAAPEKERLLTALAHLSDDEFTSLCNERLSGGYITKKEADDIKLRSLAEIDNARKRMAREKDEQVRYAAEKVLADIIPGLDNLELALQHVGGNEACKNFAIGVEMTKKLLLDSLQKHGLRQVGAIGEEFDPSLHEAMGMEESPEIPSKHVSKLLSHGYKLHERLLRPAKVLVSK